MNGKQAKKLRREAYVNDFVHAQHNCYERFMGRYPTLCKRKGFV